jgi:hypothetical protein
MAELTNHRHADYRVSTSVRINRKAKDALGEMARASGVPSRLYLELLLNYTYSIHRRPGSWEASMPFDIQTYARADTVADRWF